MARISTRAVGATSSRERAYSTPAGDVLELWQPDGAFGRLEEWLRERAFFTPEGRDRTAHLYLGYGLSGALRRRPGPAPPEPCPIPFLACVVLADSYSGVHGDNMDDAGLGAAIGAWRRSWAPTAYAGAVEEVRAAIGRGDVYQVNLVQHLAAPFVGSPGAVAARLGSLQQPTGWPLADESWRVMRGDGWAIVSASPELFLARRGDRLWTMPIKGTRPLGRAAELRASTKDAAEHVMIVDLERNDLSRVCVPGSVTWPDLMRTSSLAGVEHMVSTVEGRLRPDVGLVAILEATFPGGSVTGAPKIAAVDPLAEPDAVGGGDAILGAALPGGSVTAAPTNAPGNLIAELEPVGRGPSMGALGRIHGSGDFELALTIRTFALVDDEIHLWVGGGIVWDSDPAAEVAESLAKAAPLLAALGAPLELDRPSEPGRRTAASTRASGAGG